MTATTNSYNSIYQMSFTLDTQPDNPLKKESDQLSKQIRSLLTSSERLSALPTYMLTQIFNLRVKAMRWLAANADIDYAHVNNEVASQVKAIRNDRLEILRENLMFALRCNHRVAEGIARTHNDSGKDAPSFSEMPDITYDQYATALAMAVPDDEVFQKMIDWSNASLEVEFAFVAADLIESSGINVSDEIIDDLAALVANAAQEYYALAVELGFLKTRPTVSYPSVPHDEGFISEQKELAELGLDDFAKNFLN